MKRFLSVTAIALCFAGPAAAQQYDGCTAVPSDYETIVAPVLNGAWNVTNGVGSISGPQMNMALPAETTPEIAEIEYREDGTLTARGGEWEAIEVRIVSEAEAGSFGLAVPDEPDLESRMDFGNLGVELQCDASLLPLISMRGGTVLDGQPLEFEALVYMIHEDLLAGVFLMDFIGHSARRYVAFRR